jgi:hypothetical protein
MPGDCLLLSFFLCPSPLFDNAGIQARILFVRFEIRLEGATETFLLDRHFVNGNRRDAVFFYPCPCVLRVLHASGYQSREE